MNLIQSRPIIIRSFIALEILLIISTLTIVYLINRAQLELYFAIKLGHFFGNAAVISLCVVLIPGITRRLQQGLTLNRYLMPFRRHIGILMFIFAWSHSLLNNVLPRILTNQLFEVPPGFVVFGIFAYFLALPLFLTSNNFSVKLLKRNWAKIHRLVYLILVLTFVHVSLQQKPISLIALTTLVFLVWSFIQQKKRSLSPPIR
jgi:sulfoxide reductase heme-binding subunit YedZ